MRNNFGDNGGDRKKMYVTSIISGTKVFLEIFFVSKVKQLFIQAYSV